MFQSFNGIPTASILFFMLCSIGDNITQLSLVEKLHVEDICRTKSLFQLLTIHVPKTYDKTF